MEFGIGAVLDGKVTGITKFGAFVTLPDGKTGLVHISEIAHTFVNDIRDYLKEGQTVRVKVLGMDGTNRINLSIKKAMDPSSSRQEHSARLSGSSFAPRRPANKEPTCFEDRLKQFMQASDSKMSDLNRYIDKKGGSRRGGR